MFGFKKSRRRRGFTLPEVLVTVTVVAVLAAVVVPSVTQYIGRGNAPSSEGDLDQIANGVTGYVADTHQFPSRLSDLVSSSISGWKGPYFNASVASVPSDTNLAGATVADSVSAFQSTGLSLSFADTLENTGGAIYLTLTNKTTCSNLMALDTAVDKADGASSGRVQWTSGCALGTDTVTSRAAKIRLMTSGS